MLNHYPSTYLHLCCLHFNKEFLENKSSRPKLKKNMYHQPGILGSGRAIVGQEDLFDIPQNTPCTYSSGQCLVRGRSHITRNSKTYSCKTRHIVYSLLYCIYIAHTLQRVQGTLQNTLNIEHIKSIATVETIKAK